MAIAKPAVNADTYDDDEDLKPRKSRTAVMDRDDDEDDKPRRRSASDSKSGWDAGDEALSKEKSSEDFVKDFKFTDDATLVKFLGDGPFKVYRQHWIERAGKKSFVCLDEDENGCPLCDLLGDEPRNKFAFSVLVFPEGGTPEVQMLIAPPTLFRQLKAAHEDARKGPLGKHFWALSRSGTGPKTTYIVDMVRARDLEDEWDLTEAFVEKAIDAAEALDESAIYVTPHEELLKVAKESA